MREENLFPEGLMLLAELERKGFIRHVSDGRKASEWVYWNHLGFNPDTLRHKVGAFSIDLECDDPALAKIFWNVISETGIKQNPDPDLLVVICHVIDFKRMDEINEKTRKKGQCWMLLKVNAPLPFLGPIFSQRKESPCWRCLAHRLELHDRNGSMYQHLSGDPQPLARPNCSHPILQYQLFSLAASHIIEWSYAQSSRLESAIFTLDSGTSQTEYHVFPKRPQCNVCGNLAHPAVLPDPIKIGNQKIIEKSGGYRTESLQSTWERVQPNISEVLGIVPQLKPYFFEDSEVVHNYSSGRNLALRSKSRFWSKLHSRSMSGGKGKTELQSKTGAVCEAIERYSLMYHSAGRTVRGSLKSLENAIHPNECMLFSDSQFRERRLFNREQKNFHTLIPIEFDPDQKLDWTPVFSLTEHKFKLLPAAYCFAQYPHTDELNLLAYPDSNGCASGNTIEEAILQGLLELVERDAAAVWWYNRVQRPGISLRNLGDPYIQKVFRYYESIGRKIYLLDLTHDLGIPVYACVSHNILKGEPDSMLFSFGAHLERNIAMERAITEMNQLLPMATSFSPESLSPEVSGWLYDQKYVDTQYFHPLHGRLEEPSELPSGRTFNELGRAIEYCVKTLAENELEVLVLELTQPDINFPVARVFIPGLRHFWRRTAPGRLYEVPYKMGWQERVKLEEELNPISIFI